MDFDCCWSIVVFVLLPYYVWCAPAQLLTKDGLKIPANEVISFMKRFGYLEDDGGNSEALYSEEGISEAIKTMQKFGNITETGIIDNTTLQLMTSPRCGVPDVSKHHREKRFIIGSEGWKKRRITYYIANWSPSLGEYAVMKNIQQALDLWGKYGRLSFHRSPDNNADIIVAFASGYHGDPFPFDGPGLILAHAFYPNEGGFGGDIHFDNDEKWTSRQPNDPHDGTDFFTVAIHELGHALGLSHSFSPSSIMFPYYRGFDTEKFSLDYDDILGMYELYIRRPIVGEEIPPETTTETAASTTRIENPTNPRTSTEYTIETSTASTEFTTPSTTNTISYTGDTETVDDHKKHDTTHGIPSTNSPSLPDICYGYFDAVATLRDEMFIFKDEYVWRLQDRLRIARNYPITIAQVFPGLPKIKKIDAVYQRPDGRIILFIGANFWVYDGAKFVDSPRPLTEYELPKELSNIDAVQTWGKNGKTYIYKDDYFWRYNEHTKTMDPGYPKHIERWRGVPPNLDAATTWKDGYTYFFKAKLFWKFDNDWIIVTETSPLPAPQIWLGCPEEVNDPLLNSYG